MSDCFCCDYGSCHEEPDEPCPTCKGTKTVNELTAPDRPGFFCVGTTTCPDCEGSGTFDF